MTHKRGRHCVSPLRRFVCRLNCNNNYSPFTFPLPIFSQEDVETRTKNEEKDHTDGQHTDSLVVRDKTSRMRRSETCEEGVEQEQNNSNEDEIEGELITVKKTHLEKLEAKLSRVEDTLDEIVMFLGNNDRFASSSQLSQSHLFSKTSVV